MATPYHCNFNPLYLGKLKVWLELRCLKKMFASNLYSVMLY
ncbi:hypothetical protein NEISICOT_02869 [Neisseria sicca ATCC 29256]|uniref:Uncharacterized protein n=1 Tax=Neisseria sicca ATCC 29256 TaxID=547045 RepID=C6M8J6_NEISI|nr:hypothetical protein NEISICOT_02869 [Neisseria sicca ATCC 29256]